MSEQGLDLDSCIRAYLEIRAHSSGMAVEVRADLTGPIKALNDIYWERVEQILTRIVTLGADSLQFSQTERITLDLGVLDVRLLGTDPAEFLTRALVEINYPGGPNQFYFTEWLKARYENHVSLSKQPTESTQNAPPVTQVPDVVEKLSTVRRRIYHALHRLFENLPGIPKSVVDQLIGGRLDATIQQLILSNPPINGLYGPRCAGLRGIRSGIVLKARQRCTSNEQFAVFDALRQADERLEEELLRLAPVAAPSPLGANEPLVLSEVDERIKFLLTESRNVRSLIRLGTMGTGIIRTHSVLLTDQERLSKKDLAPILAQVRELDPHLPGKPDLLVAPFSGTGLYAWDRDTLLLPLIPMKSTEDSVLDAFANYRIIRDSTDGRGRLRSLWESTFAEADFRRDFQREYRNWVVGIGRGFRGAMDTAYYDFFKVHIGPNAKELFAPAELIRLTPDERGELIKFCRNRITTGEGTSADSYALAILYWREARYYESLQQITLATQLNPRDGRALFALGFMQIKLKEPEKAAVTLGAVGQVAPNSLWNVYALEHMSSL